MSYLFGDCELEPVRHELLRSATPVAVEPQVFTLLLYLVEHRDRLISKEELNRVIWDGRIVSEWAMSSAIKLARQAIGDNGKKQALIRTIPRRGFRFVGDVEVRSEGRADAEQASAIGHVAPISDRANPHLLKYAAAAVICFALIAGGATWWWQRQRVFTSADQADIVPVLPGKPSIAVLPFSNLSDDEAYKYFADGIALDISTDLSKISGLFVIAHEASLDPGQDGRAVGKKLGVRHVLKGSVRRAGKNIRITAQLIDVTTREHLWAERYDGSMEDVFALQDKVTERIVSAPRLQLTAGERNRLNSKETTNLAAYDRFLQG
jgi:TolB-like protein/DNA-binding winged helix-turn-helix (wHTH) protein